MPEVPGRPDGDPTAVPKHQLETGVDGRVTITPDPSERGRSAHQASRSSVRPMVGTGADGEKVMGVGKVDAVGQGRVLTSDDITMTQGIEPVDHDPESTVVMPKLVETTVPMIARKRVEMPRGRTPQQGSGK